MLVLIGAPPKNCMYHTWVTYEPYIAYVTPNYSKLTHLFLCTFSCPCPARLLHPQSCTEMSMPMSTDGIRDMFWRAPWDPAARDEQCLEEFGVSPQEGWAAAEYGGYGSWSQGTILIIIDSKSTQRISLFHITHISTSQTRSIFVLDGIDD